MISSVSDTRVQGTQSQHFFLPETTMRTEHRHIDVLGAFLVTAGLVALVALLAEGSTLGWISGTELLFLALCVIFLLAFVLVSTAIGARSAASRPPYTTTDPAGPGGRLSSWGVRMRGRRAPGCFGGPFYFA